MEDTTQKPLQDVAVIGDAKQNLIADAMETPEGQHLLLQAFKDAAADVFFKPTREGFPLYSAYASGGSGIFTGDSAELMDVLPQHSTDLVFADPPYNLQLQGDLMRPNQTKVSAVDDAWDKFPTLTDYDNFTRKWIMSAKRILKPNGSLWVMGSYTNLYRVGYILQDLGFWIINEIVWQKVNPMPNMKGTRFCNAHETLIWAVPSKQARPTFHYKLMKAANEDKQMRSVWELPICSGGERMTNEHGEKAHSTQKPEGLMHRVLLATTNPGDIIVDPFSGSGTTAAVAKKLGRRFLCIDNKEEYVELGRRRVDAIEGADETLLSTIPLYGAVKPKVAFGSLVEAGVLPAGTELTLYRTAAKPTDHTAVVNIDGTVTSGEYRGSIHQVGKLALGLPACNGWDHWHVYDADKGGNVPIDGLRNVYLSQAAHALEEAE